jgi:nucleoside-triphosphatase THEP1
MNDNERLAVAAIVRDEHDSADELLTDFAYRLRGLGWRVQGVVQTQTARDDHCACEMVLVDLEDGNRFLISQNLGPGSVSCRVDPAGVAAASVSLRRALAEGANLVIVNRFGRLEAGGGGFAAEMLALMANGVPMLTMVSERYLDEWRRFTGHAGSELPAQRQALETWFADLNLTK